MGDVSFSLGPAEKPMGLRDALVAMLVLPLILILASLVLPIVIPICWIRGIFRRRGVIPSAPSYSHHDFRCDLLEDVPLDDILQKCDGRFPERSEGKEPR